MKERTEKTEDLTWQKRRSESLIEQRAWAKRRQGSRVIMRRDIIWVNVRCGSGMES